MAIALDATYSVGSELSGVGVYSREILFGITRAHPEERFRFCYRPHRFLRSFRDPLPSNVRRAIVTDTRLSLFRPSVFHGLNQRMPALREMRRVCTFHDLFVMTGDYSTPEFRARFSDQARQAAERSDLIITVSAFTARQVRDLLGVDAARLRVVHHGIRPLGAPPASRRPIVLSVGAIQARKNTERLVNAFETMPREWSLVLVGSPTGYGAPRILSAIESSSARDRIRVTGYIGAAELASWYAQASVFAFPSLDEGFGMPVLEAMAAGVPVIASSRSALPEVCGDAAVLVDPLDTDQIAAALLRVGEDAALRQSLSEKGIQRVGNFTWRSAVESTWRVYRELLD